MRLLAVWFTLIVSVSGVMLEFFSYAITLVSGVLGVVALFDLFVLSAPKRLQARLLAVTPFVHGAALLGGWLAAFYLIYPSPLANGLILLSAFMLPALYLPCFAHAAPKRALRQALGILGLFLLLALPHAYASIGEEGLFSGFLFPLILFKTHSMMLAFLTLTCVHTERLHFLAQHDPLTGLANRRQLETALREALKGARRTQQPYAVLILDVDDFKKVNDAFGHGRGDMILREVAQQLAGAVRTGSTLGRWGGEEFMVLATVTDVHEAWGLGERLRSTVADACLLDDYPTTLSVGVAVWQDEDTFTTLVTRADRALYLAKREGRNRTELARA